MREERVILGENCIYSTNCNETGINNNVLVCGGSGSGKTAEKLKPFVKGAVAVTADLVKSAIELEALR